MEGMRLQLGRLGYIRRQVVPVLVMVLCAIWFGMILGGESDTARYSLVVYLIGALATVAFPAVFFGIVQSGVSGSLGGMYVYGAGVWVPFLPALPFAAAVVYLARRGERLFPRSLNMIIVSQLAFTGMLALGITYSSDPVAGADLLFRFSYYNLALCALPLAFANGSTGLRNIAYGFGVSAVVVGLSAVFAYGQMWAGEVVLPNLVVYFYDERTLGCGIVFLVWLLMLRGKRRVLGGPLVILYASLCAVLLFNLVMLGRRAALLAVFLAVLVCIYLTGKLSLRSFALVGLVGLAVFFSYDIIQQGFGQRRNMLEVSHSVGARQELYGDRLYEIRQAPVLGRGTGTGYGEGSHSHNIFLEIAYQLGTIGVVPFLVLVFGVARAAGRVWRDQSFREDQRNLMILLVSWFIVYFVVAQSSFYLLVNRNLWFIAGLIGVLASSPTIRPLPEGERQRGSRSMSLHVAER